MRAFLFKGVRVGTRPEALKIKRWNRFSGSLAMWPANGGSLEMDLTSCGLGLSDRVASCILVMAQTWIANLR